MVNRDSPVFLEGWIEWMITKGWMIWIFFEKLKNLFCEEDILSWKLSQSFMPFWSKSDSHGLEKFRKIIIDFLFRVEFDIISFLIVPFHFCQFIDEILRIFRCYFHILRLEWSVFSYRSPMGCDDEADILLTGTLREYRDIFSILWETDHFGCHSWRF